EVSVTLGREYYPTRDYGTFALPAGSYESLRVVLGEGRGHNWWCVVFPPLCLSAAETESALETLGGDSAQLLSGEGEGVVFKFRLLELWGELMEYLGLD
ncbi:MAG: stage II sporulation protein R, partial [Oscillospiraceae bacterium]